MRARLNVPNHNYRLQAQEAWNAFCTTVVPPPIAFDGVDVVNDELACDGLPANAIASRNRCSQTDVTRVCQAVFASSILRLLCR